MAIEIDGSEGEGGGQVLRTGLALSCVLGVPLKISNIRAGREKVGLAPQHLAVVNALAKISSAKVKGVALGSTRVEFEPGEITGGKYEFDIGSAGAVTLLAQALLPVLCAAKERSRVVLRGGTHVRGAPLWDYFEEVFLGCAGRFGVNVVGKLDRAGFYPKGEGEAEILVESREFRAVDFLEREIAKTKCRIYSCGLPAHVAQREKEAIAKELGVDGGSFEIILCKAACAGNAIALWNGGIGACALGEAGKRAEEVAHDAAAYFSKQVESKAVVDSHCADQLLLYMALANGKCSIRTSETSSHLKTNIGVIEKFLAAKFKVEGTEGNFIVTSSGM